MTENRKDLFIDIKAICYIFDKKLKDLTESDWDSLKLFKEKITISTSFAHRFSKQSREFTK